MTPLRLSPFLPPVAAFAASALATYCLWRIWR